MCGLSPGGPQPIPDGADRRECRRGSFGRLLAYLEISGENFNYQFVALGYARVYDSSFSQRDRFYDAEESAQTSQTGAWRCQNVAGETPTETPAPGSGDLAVAAIHADAPGNDQENLNEEYIVFENTGRSTLNLSGWTILDEAVHTYVVPSGVTVAPGVQITLYSGSGADSQSALYWGSESAIWNNGGDKIIVRDRVGNVRIALDY